MTDKAVLSPGQQVMPIGVSIPYRASLNATSRTLNWRSLSWIPLFLLLWGPSVWFMPWMSALLDGGCLLLAFAVALRFRWMGVLLLMPMAVCVLQAGNSLHSHRIIDQYLLTTLASTAKGETWMYLTGQGVWRMTFFAALILVPVASLVAFAKARVFHHGAVALTGGAFLATFGAAAMLSPQKPAGLAALAYTSYYGTVALRAMIVFVHPYYVYAKGFKPIQTVILDAHSTEKAVLVIIGESATRLRMGMYGYLRDTTPLMRRNDVQFGDLLSVGLNTQPNVQAMLTGLTVAVGPDSGQDLFRLARRTGYSTHYIDNNRFVNDDPIFRLASQADTYTSLNGVGATNRANDNRLRHDEVMGDELKRIIRKTQGQPKTLIFVHLAGSHFDHQLRYPESFNRFPSHYDNSILYTDAVVSQMKDAFLKAHQGQPAAVIYLADHGLKLPPGCGLGPVPEVEDMNYGNDEKFYTNMSVPLVMWFNDAFKARDGDLYRNALAAKDQPLDQRFLFWSVANLMGATAVNGASVNGLSVFSPQANFLPRRNVYGEDIDQKIASGEVCKP